MPMQTLWHDLRYGARMPARNAIFAVVAVVTLALGIGANTALFSLVQAVLLHSLPYHQPNRLVALEGDRATSVPIEVSYGEAADWKARRAAPCNPLRSAKSGRQPGPEVLRKSFTGLRVTFPGAVSLSYLPRRQPYGVSPNDLPTFFEVLLVVALVALVACFLPTRRATRVDLLVALRYE